MWKTSSYSPPTTDTPRCVEVRTGAVVGIRDTKDRGRTAVTVTATAWRQFLAGIQETGGRR